MDRTVAAGLLLLCASARADDIDLTSLTPEKPQPAGWRVTAKQAELTAQRWSFLRTKDSHAYLRVRLEVTLLRPAKQFGFFGSSWSVWPDFRWWVGSFRRS